MRRIPLNGSRLLSGVLGLFILWECVRPVVTLTILNNPVQLLLFLVIPILLLSMGMPLWLALLAGIIQTGLALHDYFFRDLPLFDTHWLNSAFRDLVGNVWMIWQGDLTHLSDLFCAFLFFVLLWLICVVFWRWMKTGRLYLYLFLAVASVSMVDTFTFVKTAQSLILVVAAGLLMVGIENYNRLTENSVPPVSRYSFYKWLLILTLSLLLVFAAGLSGPKAAPLWTSPVTYLQDRGLIGGSILSSGQRIGYDTDDTSLGGSLSMDSTVLFTARTSGSASYWRVATKHIYTGKGWAAGQNGYFIPLVGSSYNLNAVSLYEKNTSTSKESASLTFTKASPAILPYAGQLTSLVAADHPTIKINPDAGQVMTADEKPVQTEVISYLQPTYQVPSLRRVKGNQDPRAIRSRYLQLPGELPNRVRALAGKLTAKSANRYEAVMAILNYLKSSRFTYSTDQVPKPVKNQDYVDQFLFTSRAGYCDNFSTSMVVLLRSAGIPSRWVKGFATGEYTGQTEVKVKGKTVTQSVYQIKNADAHSWVDVYFPGSGWVSFDPTPTFADPSSFAAAAPGGNASSHAATSASGASGASSSAASSAVSRAPSQGQSSAPANQRNLSQTQTFGYVPGKKQVTGHVSLLIRIIGMAVGVVLLAALLVAFLTRKSWLRLILNRRISKLTVTDGASFDRAYNGLLRLLRLNGLKRRASQTLREFAAEVDKALSGEEMSRLTYGYERFIYSDQTMLSEKEQRDIQRILQHISGKLSSRK
jgi:Transglutaminase-like enzymes, putative cysteine proteases